MAEQPDDLRQRADDVLSQRKFQGDEPGPIDRALEWISDLITDLLSVITSGTAFGGVAVGWIVLGLMLALIIYFLVRYMPRRQASRDKRVKATVVTEQTRRSRAEWLEAAAAADAAGLHREAVRARYRATVAGLIESKELPDAPGSTSLELLDAFGAEASRTDPFASSTSTFSDVWYGGDDAERSDSDRLAENDRRVVSTKASE